MYLDQSIGKFSGDGETIIVAYIIISSWQYYQYMYYHYYNPSDTSFLPFFISSEISPQSMG